MGPKQDVCRAAEDKLKLSPPLCSFSPVVGIFSLLRGALHKVDGAPDQEKGSANE